MRYHIDAAYYDGMSFALVGAFMWQRRINGSLIDPHHLHGRIATQALNLGADS